MERKIVPLNHEYLGKLLMANPMRAAMAQAYFSRGSVSYCLLVDGEPVFAGGVVNMQWQRGEAWILPTKWFFQHLVICYRYVRDILPLASIEGHFRRIQATCAVTVSTALFEHLGFVYEGTMQSFGPNGETCHMYAKVFRKP